MSSLVAHKDEYEKMDRNFREHWHAERIIKVIEKINPNFFPVALPLPNDFAEFINLAHANLLRTPAELEKLPRLGKGQLTKAEYSSLYSYSSNLIHTKNPFSQTKLDVEQTLIELRQYHDKITLLLQCHRTNVLGQGFYYTLLNSKEHNGLSAVYQVMKSKYLDRNVP